MKFSNKAAGSTVAKTRPLLDPRTFVRARRSETEALVRDACESAYLGDATSLCRVLGRYKLVVDTRDDGIAPHLLLDGYWKMWLTEALVEWLPSGTVAAEVGAHCGYFSVVMADLCGGAGHVHVYEANPAMATLARRNLAMNGRGATTTVHSVAVTDVEGGSAGLHLPQGNPKNARVTAIDADDAVPGLTLATTRLDAKPEAAKFSFVKIDVGGAEAAVWRGMEGLLAGDVLQTVMLEFSAARHDDPAAFLDGVIAAGFALNLIDPDAGIVETTVAGVLDRDRHADVTLLLTR